MEMWMPSKNAKRVTDGTRYVTYYIKLITLYNYRKTNKSI